MAEFDKDDILERPKPYKILRQIHFADDGSYSVQMDLKAGIDEEIAEEIIEIMTEQDILYPISGTDPQLYDINYASFEGLWEELWSRELDDVPATPLHFGTFMEHYVKSFLDTEESSTVREMMVDEFFVALKGRELDNQNLVPESYKELLYELTDVYDGKKSVHEHIQHAFNNID